MARGEARRVCPFVRSSPSVFSSFILFLSSFSVPFFIFFYFVRSFQHVFSFFILFSFFSVPFSIFFFFFRDATPFPLTLSRRLFSVSLLSPSFCNHPYTFFFTPFFPFISIRGFLLSPSPSSPLLLLLYLLYLFLNPFVLRFFPSCSYPDRVLIPSLRTFNSSFSPSSPFVIAAFFK